MGCMSEIGQTFKKRRSLMGKTQQEIAGKRLRLMTLSDLENGKNVKVDTLERAAEALGVKVSELYRDLEGETRQSEPSSCCDKHAKICRMLEYILHNAKETDNPALRTADDWIHGNLVVFYSALGGPPLENADKTSAGAVRLATKSGKDLRRG